jgi:hypothetical protein
MRKVAGILFIMVLSSWMTSPVTSQGLFESSQSGNYETLVSSKLSLGGFIRSVIYTAQSPETDKYYLQSAYGQVGLQLDAKAGEWASAKADIRFRYGTEFQKTISQAEIREACVDLWKGPLSLKFGKMITPWGKGTFFNPVDKLTPLDPTVRSPVEDDMKLGFWGIQGGLTLGRFMKLTATWKPLFQPSVLLIDPVPMPAYVTFLDPDYPGVELNQGSYGINYNLFTSLMDVSLYWYDGYSNWPGIGYDSFILDSMTMDPAALNLFEKAYKIRMAGADFSIPAGSWIFRAEVAWQQTVESPGSAEYLPFHEISYTAEIEKSGNHFNILAGYLGKYIIDYTAPLAEPSLQAGQEQIFQLMQMGVTPTGEAIDGMIREQIGAFNRLYNYQMEEFYNTLFLAVKLFLWHDQIELTIPVISYLTTDEWVFQPGIAFKPLDGLNISAGYGALYGPEESLLDLVGPTLNAGYLSIKLTF